VQERWVRILHNTGWYVLPSATPIEREDRTPSLSPTDRHELLADSYRRTLLSALADRDGGPVSIETATEIVATEHPSVASASITASLYHCHLPKLADHGVLEWTPETGTVSAGPAFDASARVETETCPTADGDL